MVPDKLNRFDETDAGVFGVVFENQDAAVVALVAGANDLTWVPALDTKPMSDPVPDACGVGAP
jgi:hypothetical protein